AAAATTPARIFTGRFMACLLCRWCSPRIRGAHPGRITTCRRFGGFAGGRYPVLSCPRSSGDRASASGAVCVGSNPAEGALVKYAPTSQFLLVRAFLFLVASN